VLIIPYAWGSQLPGHNHHHQLHASHQVFSGAVAEERRRIISLINWAPSNSNKSFLAPLPGKKKKTSARGVFRTHILYFVLLFCFTLFYLHRFIKNPKNLESLIVVIFTCLALSCFLSLVGFFETKSFWQGGFTEEQQNYYDEHRLSQKG
jgi:hypothetical protein